jgi:hypothetical protein
MRPAGLQLKLTPVSWLRRAGVSRERKGVGNRSGGMLRLARSEAGRAREQQQFEASGGWPSLRGLGEWGKVGATVRWLVKALAAVQ